MKKTVGILVFLLIFLIQGIFAQEKKDEVAAEKKPQALKFDQLPKGLNSEERSARIDYLISELQNYPNSKAAVLFYCGKTCFYGEFEAHIRGIVKMKLNPRKFDTNRFVFIHAGYSNESYIQLWIIPDGADLPLPEPTIKFEDVKFKGLFKWKIVSYDCCEI